MYWVGQKVGSSFSITAYGNHERTFWPPQYSVEYSSVWILLKFAHDWLDVLHSWQAYPRSDVQSFSEDRIEGYVMPTCLITGHHVS